ncbi:MAG: NADH-quinone oxidoreductase subunit NuoN [Rhodospirillales bacterium]|jgi:NADH-quinone oxidoreductase subunit N|nr:NADH-quinone oxidoreductase subunit NuoN [Rhodospirillales bacterium]
MPLAEVPNLVPALPEVFMALAAMALLLAGVVPRDGDAATATFTSRTVGRLGVLTLIVAMLLVVGVAAQAPGIAFGGLFVVDGYALFFKVVILLASALCLIISQGYLEAARINRFEYPVLVVLATLGMMMMISANDLISLYIGLELQSLALYVIAAFHRDDARSAEAGLKYFVLGALASGLLLYGASLVYGFAGSTGFDTLTEVMRGEPGAPVPSGVIVGLVFVIAGLAFKVSAVPFHMWTPDVYEGAPTPVTAFFAVAPKLAAMGLLLRVMVEPFGGLTDQWQQVITFVAIASMVLGAFAAIGQTNIKRLMAYSSIGHVGYALIGLAVGSREGIASILVYMVIYAVMTLGTFACILSMRRRGQMTVAISDLAGLSKTDPVLALALAVFMFSLAGVPPLAGFFGKFYIFVVAVDAQAYVLAVIAALASAVGAFYYLRIVKIMYFDPPADGFDANTGTDLRLVIIGAALLTAFFFLVPGPLLTSAASAAAALFAG